MFLLTCWKSVDVVAADGAHEITAAVKAASGIIASKTATGRLASLLFNQQQKYLPEERLFHTPYHINQSCHDSIKEVFCVQKNTNFPCFWHFGDDGNLHLTADASRGLPTPSNHAYYPQWPPESIAATSKNQNFANVLDVPLVQLIALNLNSRASSVCLDQWHILHAFCKLDAFNAPDSFCGRMWKHALHKSESSPIQEMFHSTSKGPGSQAMVNTGTAIALEQNIENAKGAWERVYYCLNQRYAIKFERFTLSANAALAAKEKQWQQTHQSVVSPIAAQAASDAASEVA
ncbi:hypothetical protein CBOM_05198 [Ceraceosorus bombacis]|uniref:Uncharacterized protein n=1 Tax=Ceraceosorus bombacis TaxID=401625 RepID=A0A0P1BI72_9BASI|nr:hypothetical protein CBOM_05198 [Ceraceosorus bombacis]